MPEHYITMGRSRFLSQLHMHADNVPPSLPRRYLETHHIGPKLLHRLHYEVGFGAVEKCDAAAVSARHIRRDDAVAVRPPGVDAICDLQYP